jgi:hypothetical protein
MFGSNIFLQRVLIGLAASLFSVGAVSQDRDQFNDSGLSVKLGETDLFPSIRLDILQNSNVFLQSSEETKATDISVSPTLRWAANRRLLDLQATYDGKYNVSTEDALTIADHSFNLSADAELTSRKRVSGNLGLNFGHEDISKYLNRDTSDLNNDPVTFNDLQLDGSYRYGAYRARGNIVAGISLRNFQYTSRDDVTSGSSYLKIEPFAEFSLRLSGDTRLLSEIRFGRLNYDNEDLDRNDLSLLTGIQFDTTGKSGGSFRVGVLQSKRVLSDADDQTEFVMRARLFWEPASFSRFVLEGTRELDNFGSTNVDISSPTAIRDIIMLRWDHTWSSRLSHIATIQSDSTSRSCPDLGQNIVSGSLELNLQIRRWLSVGLNGRGASRQAASCPQADVDAVDLDYDQTLVGAHIRATL